jgi:hypothetical protein
LIAAGVLSAVAYLTRYDGVFVVSGVFLGVLLIDAARLEKGRVISCGLLLAAFAVTITPWGLHCLQEKGQFLYHTNYRDIAYALYGEGAVSWNVFWEARAGDFRSFLDVFLEGPVLFVKAIVSNFHGHFLNDIRDLLGWHTGILVLPGIIITVLRRPKPTRAVYLLLNALLFGVLLTVFYNPRFSLFLVPAYCVLALQTLDWIGAVFSQRRRLMSWLIPAAATSLVVWTAVEGYQFNRCNISKGPTEILIIAEWFERNVPAEYRGEVIVSRTPQIAYYMDLEFEWMPDVKTYDELVAELRTMKADYLYFSYLEARWRPELAFLLNAEQKYPGIMPILFMKNPSAVLYRVEAG